MKKILGFLIVLASILILTVAGAYAATGSQLVSQYGCLGCHNPIPTTTTNSGEYNLIYNAINSGPMKGISSLKSLTTSDIQAIADYLVPATPTPTACTSYTYTLGACQPNGTAPVVSYVGIPAGCSGGATPATTQPCTYTPPVCTSFNYSSWGACQPDGTQSRTVISGSPSGCTGGSPALTRSCTYTPPTPDACTYTYSDWSACQSDGTQSRTVVSSSPAGCTGSPVLSQSCTYTPPAPGTCTYTYSDWSACQSDGTQSRTVVSSSPAGCTGSPVLSQSCTYTPPSSQDILPDPNGGQIFAYDPVDIPVLSSDPAQAEPIGVGDAASGGDTLSIRVQAEFSDPVNVSLSIYAPSVDNLNLYFMGPSNLLQSLSQGILDSETTASAASSDSSYNSNDGESEGEGHGSEHNGSVVIDHATLENFVLWKKNVTSLDENPVTVPVSDLPAGVYTVVLTVRPSNNGYSFGEDAGNPNYYRWTTYFLVK